MHRLHLAVATALVAGGCTPALGDAPFSCTEEASCPDGYVCRSTLCVRAGAQVEVDRTRRVTWFNAGEMFWLPRPGGGAALIVNDGFTEGAQGLYEILVSPGGLPEPARLIFRYNDEFPRSTSVLALDDARYGVVMLRYPPVDMDQLALEVFSVQREAPADTTPAVETLFSSRKEPYLGGAAPPYVGAASGDGWMDVAWTPPTSGGTLEVLRLEQQSSRWTQIHETSEPLPESILPLSGDAVFWQSGADELTVRVGFKRFALARVDPAGNIASFVSFTNNDDVPLYAFGDELFVLRYGGLQRDDRQPPTEFYPVTYALQGATGAGRRLEVSGVLPPTTEPYTATPFQGGALLVPFSSDPELREIGVGWVSPSQAITRVAGIARTSADPLYSARAFAADGKVYVAWTEIHGAWMDLWQGTADIGLPEASARGARSSRAMGSSSQRSRVFSWRTGAFERGLGHGRSLEGRP